MTDQAIKRMNLSFIWTRTFFSFFKPGATGQYPYGFIASSSGYKDKFKELRSADNYDRLDLSLPWTKQHSNSFWKYYFKQKEPRDIPANLAWQYLVPFRKRVATSISTPWLNNVKAVIIEGFFYAHGIAAVITIRVRDCDSLDEMVDHAFPTRWGGVYNVTWGDNSSGEFSLGGLASHLLDSFCKEALGPDQGTGIGFSGDPFSISTVVEGGGAYKTMLVEQGNLVHQVLEKLTTWNENFPAKNQPKLEEKILKNIKNPQDNHLLYASKQGRAVWFPQLFTPPETKQKRYALGWYHRNLVLSSLQTASLGAFLSHTAVLLKKGEHATEYHTSWAKYALEALYRLYQGDNTYRTWSIHEQIEQNGLLEAITYLFDNL